MESRRLFLYLGGLRRPVSDHRHPRGRADQGFELEAGNPEEYINNKKQQGCCRSAFKDAKQHPFLGDDVIQQQQMVRYRHQAQDQEHLHHIQDARGEKGGGEEQRSARH